MIVFVRFFESESSEKLSFIFEHRRARAGRSFILMLFTDAQHELRIGAGDCCSDNSFVYRGGHHC